MSFVYNIAKLKFATGDIHLDTDDIQVLLVMTNTTADSDEEAANLAAFVTLDEFDGSSYSRQEIDPQNTAIDTSNDRAEFTTTNTTVFSGMGTGSRNIQAAILFQNVATGTDSLNIPIAYIDGGGFPFSASVGTITITWDGEGILQFT